MTIQQEIKRIEQSIARCEKSWALEKLKKRRADTQRKIEFGGLVIKAAMDSYEKTIIIGALHFVSVLLKEEGYKNLFQMKGQHLLFK